MVNTCGFVEAGEEGLASTPCSRPPTSRRTARPQAVVAVGCLAERYGDQLAESLPEADAVLGFDDYADIGARLRRIVAGERHVPHAPRDRRLLLPLSPVDRAGGRRRAARPRASTTSPTCPTGVAPASGPRVVRRRLGVRAERARSSSRQRLRPPVRVLRDPVVPRLVRVAPPVRRLAEARWLAGQGVRELVLVSENSTSYGKDLGDLRLLETLLPELAAVDGIDWVRVSYLQPAETRPTLLEVIATTPGVVAVLRPVLPARLAHGAAPHAPVRRHRVVPRPARRPRARCCRTAGARSNVIVGFPGETEDDVEELERFLVAARLDAVGVFGYSDEDGTEAATYDGKLDDDVVRERVERITALVEELTSQRAEDRHRRDRRRCSSRRSARRRRAVVEGRSAHQAPEVDGCTLLVDGALRVSALRRGRLVTATVVGSDGVDLVAAVAGASSPAVIEPAGRSTTSATRSSRRRCGTCRTR